jgi:hypothetical protein
MEERRVRYGDAVMGKKRGVSKDDGDEENEETASRRFEVSW